MSNWEAMEAGAEGGAPVAAKEGAASVHGSGSSNEFGHSQTGDVGVPDEHFEEAPPKKRSNLPKIAAAGVFVAVIGAGAFVAMQLFSPKPPQRMASKPSSTAALMRQSSNEPASLGAAPTSATGPSNALVVAPGTAQMLQQAPGAAPTMAVTVLPQVVTTTPLGAVQAPATVPVASASKVAAVQPGSSVLQGSNLQASALAASQAGDTVRLQQKVNELTAQAESLRPKTAMQPGSPASQAVETVRLQQKVDELTAQVESLRTRHRTAIDGVIEERADGRPVLVAKSKHAMRVRHAAADRDSSETHGVHVAKAGSRGKAAASAKASNKAVAEPVTTDAIARLQLRGVYPPRGADKRAWVVDGETMHSVSAGETINGAKVLSVETDRVITSGGVIR